MVGFYGSEMCATDTSLEGEGRLVVSRPEAAGGKGNRSVFGWE